MTGNELRDGVAFKVETIINHSQKLEEDIKKVGLKVKHHEDNLEFLKRQIKSVDRCIHDTKVMLGTYHNPSVAVEESNNISLKNSEEQTVEHILALETSAAGIICQMKVRHALQASKLPLTKDVLGVVATLGKVNDDKLSRAISEFLGLENMLAIVCKSYDGVKALEKYGSEGMIDRSAGLHGLGPSIGRLLDGRFLVFCLENLRNNVEVKFPVSSGISNTPTEVIEMEEKVKLMNWKKERLVEDLSREQALLNEVKNLFNTKSQELSKLLDCVKSAKTHLGQIAP